MINWLRETPPMKALRKWGNQRRWVGNYVRMARSLWASSEKWHLARWAYIAQFVPFTMVYYERLRDTYNAVKTIEQEQIKGSFVECGVWKGGCAALMASPVRRTSRRIHLFDSFEGLPEPKEIDGTVALTMSQGRKEGKLETIHKAEASIDEVRRLLFGFFRLNPEKVLLHQGWFQDTLPPLRESFEPIAILRLDGDWYDSTMVCLENLYDHVVSGGFVIIDDYGHFEGCRKATDEFLARRGMQVQLVWSDYTGVYFRKP